MTTTQRICVYLSIFLSISGCKAHSSRALADDEGGLAHNLDKRIAESLHFTMSTMNVRAVLDAAQIAGDAIQFGNEMAKLYDECHEAPKCPEQSLGSDTQPMQVFAQTRSPHVERSADKTCYPNAVLKNVKTEAIARRGFWMTGETGVPLAEQEQARARGQAVAKNLFNNDSGVANAARHSYLFCFLSAKYGYETAKVFADNHEDFFPEDGLEDTWADYWNNEQGLRYGSIVHRISFAATDADVSFMRSSVLPYQQTQKNFPPKAIPDIVDIRLFPQEGSGKFMATDWVLSAMCKRYLEGVIRGEVLRPDSTGQSSAVLMMTHRPSIQTRLDQKTFAPLLGPGSETSQLVPMGRFDLPTVQRGGLPWLHAAPIPPKRDCVLEETRSAKYWRNLPPTLSGADGDYFRYWPSYDPKLDRHQSSRRP